MQNVSFGTCRSVAATASRLSDAEEELGVAALRRISVHGRLTVCSSQLIGLRCRLFWP
jgi:hypothetical protein